MQKINLQVIGSFSLSRIKFARVILLSFLSLIFTYNLYAQVTIGSDRKPASGALLDLKQKEGNSGEETSTKGLGLPLVKLTKLKPATDMELARSIGNTTGSYNRGDHVGLFVYNINDDSRGCVSGNNVYRNTPPQGIYVWSGEEWQFLSGQEDTSEKDVRTLTYGSESVTSGGITVGTFTMKYDDRVNPAENKTYYYADFGKISDGTVVGKWMTQNLDTKYAPNGTLLKNSAAQVDIAVNKYNYAYPSSSSPVSSSDYDANMAYGYNIGLLYDWYTATDSHNCSVLNQAQANNLNPDPSTQGANEIERNEESGHIKGICPKGWHLPSDRDWNALEKHLTENAAKYTQNSSVPSATWTNGWETTSEDWRGTVTGKVIKSVKVVRNSIFTLVNSNSKAAIDGGFDGYAAGFASRGSSSRYGGSVYFWTASGFDSSKAWIRLIDGTNSSYNGVYRTYVDRYTMYSVRCKKD